MKIHRIFRGLFAVCLLCMCFVCSACSTSESKEANHFAFNTKEAHRILEDGWVYYCYAVYEGDALQNTDELLYYYYGACNTKYKSIKGYDKVPIVDTKTGEIIEYAESQMPHLLYGANERTELENLNDYLNEKKFCEETSSDKMKDFNFEKLDEKLFIDLFNQMISSAPIEDHGFCEWPESGMIQDEALDGYQWQIGFYVAHGTLVDITITPVVIQNEQGINLSDLDSMDAEDDELCSFLEAMEKDIIEKQSFSNVKLSGRIGRFDLVRLERLMKQLPSVH